MSRISSLGMYDHSAQRAANDQLWAAVARALRDKGLADVPDTLDRSRSVQEIWRDPDLLFGQVCGYPLASDQTLSLQILGLPAYAAPGCAGDEHGSFIIARASDAANDLLAFRGGRAAMNDRGSNSGMNLFRAAIAPIAGGPQFFAEVVETGSHRQSAWAVVRGSADLAAIDIVTYAALDRFEPDLIRQLRVVARTPRSPTLPFVTGSGTNAATVALLREALASIIVDPNLSDVRADLFLTRVTPGGIDRFVPLLQLERDAARAGYPELR